MKDDKTHCINCGRPKLFPNEGEHLVNGDWVCCWNCRTNLNPRYKTFRLTIHLDITTTKGFGPLYKDIMESAPAIEYDLFNAIPQDDLDDDSKTEYDIVQDAKISAILLREIPTS